MDLKAVIKEKTSVVVHCSAEWSQPCRQMEDVLQELSTMHPSLTFLTVDIEKDTTVQKEYNIQAVPHFLFFKEGRLVDRAEGADPSVLIQKLDGFGSSDPSPSTKIPLSERIKNLISSADVMLFMKGTPDAPRCGFSSKVVDALNTEHVKFSFFDILTDEVIRQGVKEYSCWPTYPQLYVNGELLGGCEIILAMKEKGKLQTEIVDRAGDGVLNETLDQQCERLTKKAPVMLFMKGSPSAPRCKFSSRVVGALNDCGVEFGHFDILEDDSVRQGIKNYAQWPTFPQLYIRGELIGGCEIVEEMHSKGELASCILEDVPSQNLTH